MTTRASTAVLLAACALLATAAPAVAGPTTERTIQDRDGDDRLEFAPRDPYIVRDDLGEARRGREGRRQGRVVFGQLTDMHVVDEESPLRVEFLDRLGDPFTSAYRPQEGMSAQVLNEMVAEVRRFSSPASRRRSELVMTTGDNSDNSQLNETRWFIDLLDGGVSVDPNSGREDGTCGPSNGRLYDGVRGGNEYYEPDSSAGAEAGADNQDGAGYSPNQDENEREAGRSSTVRDFPGLFEAMNRPFRATGLGVPWYGIFGNHDGLVQGNQPRNPGLEAIATGCVKVSNLTPSAETALRALAAGGMTATERMTADTILLDSIQGIVGGSTAGSTVVVPKDERRRPLRKQEYIAQHFATRGTPRGHGFTAQNLATGQGHYSFRPKPGTRFLVLDSVAETGGPDGNLDEEQFQWIHRQLVEAEARREVVFAFAHHSLETMNMVPAPIFGVGDQGGNANPLVHFGEGPGGDRNPTPCTITNPATPPTPDETLRCLFLRHPSVVGFVVGHEHDNRVRPVERRPGTGRAEGGFWQVVTASHIDWPQQSRVLDLVNNRDGSLSIFGTIIDHAGAPDPGGSGVSSDPRRLASISRELSFNDPDANNGEGRPDRRGDRDDRNVELLVRNPFPASSGGGGDDDDD